MGDDPNSLLAQARARLRSPSGSGLGLSRQELADAVSAYIWNTWDETDRVDATWIGHLEQGRYRWPRQRRREALRAVLGVVTDAELGLFCTPRGPHSRDQRRGGTPASPVSEPPWHAPGDLLSELATEPGDVAGPTWRWGSFASQLNSSIERRQA
ncbi:hypothetical protein [Actinoplanes sp. NBRC 103695]|uniref:hypothetical protein n=1 Tax=Actinoplanes sp. NBRC 103695 TaxID=3032202 RepID=UPI0024A0315A|nr:hypothetical protein [Actinoplanes sp. NBRC 103695]GLY95028.1 hypothetical protein Acsp02_22830 [Actinoplanes sp. NBRC 103695]